MTVILEKFVGGYTNRINKCYVSLPTTYDIGKKYKFIYHLHPASDIDILIRGKDIIERLENIYQSNHKEAIIIVPICDFAYSLWTDSYDGSYLDESKFIFDLIPYLENKYSCSERFIEGFSMGGFGAVKMLFKYPNLFRKAINYDGGFFTYKSLNYRLKNTQEVIFNNEEYFDENDPFKILLSNKDILGDSSLLSIIGLLKKPNKELRKLMEANDLAIKYIPTQFKHQYFEIIEKYCQDCFDFYQI